MVTKFVNGKKIVVNEYGHVYCHCCKRWFRSENWAFEHRAPNYCNRCKSPNYYRKTRDYKSRCV